MRRTAVRLRVTICHISPFLFPLITLLALARPGVGFFLRSGGRSVIEVNGEARIKVIDQFGVVPFVDGGQVYDEVYPRLTSGDLQWAGGLGLRYYSPVGPIRFDVAFPLNPRGIDDPFQFYISIGQAF